MKILLHLLIPLVSFTSIFAEPPDVLTNCLNCVDQDGKNCDTFLRRYAKSKYWVLKGDAMQSYSEAETSCSTYGKTVAQIRSDADLAVFKDLAEDSGYSSYWAVDAKSDELNKIIIDETGEMQPEDGDSGTHATVCQYPDGHTCLKIQSTVKNKSLDSNDPKCPHPTFGEENQFVRTGPNSKYLYPAVKVFGTWDFGKQACESAGLEMAEVKTLVDYYHLRDQWINNKQLNVPLDKTFYATLVGRVEKSSGDVMNEYTGRAIDFQLFNIQDFEGDGCNALKTIGSLVYFALVSCDNKNFMPLCQYKSDSECYLSTPLAAAEQEDVDGLFFLESVGNRMFYGSRKQKTSAHAAEFCQESNMNLLDFVKSKTLETRMIWGVIQKYQNIINFPNLIGKSWTSGIFEGGYAHEAPFTFESTGDTWTPEDTKDHFVVISDEVRNPTAEKCLLVVGPQQLRPFLCTLPNYFVCYKIDPTIEKPEPTPTPGSENSTANATEEPETITPKPSNCNGEPITLSLDLDELPNEEILALIGLSYNLNFMNGYSDVLKIREESSWRITHVKAMGALTKHVCPEPHVNKEFINILMNLVMIYYNSVPESPRSQRSKLFWKKMAKRYEKCQQNTEPLGFSSTAGLIHGVETPDAVADVLLPLEIVDGSDFALDIILEGLWYMFEVTATACYNEAKWKITWLAEYFQTFRVDFTEQFKDWWTAPMMNNYGLLFGDMDLYAELYNLRACAISGFQRLGILDKLPVRPVNVKHTNFMMRDANARVFVRPDAAAMITHHP